MRYVFKRFAEAFEVIVRPRQYVRLDDNLARALRDMVRADGGNGLEIMNVRRIAVDMIYYGLRYQWTNRENILAWEQLTAREKEVAACVCLGYSNRQISRRLVIAPSTVKTHVRNVLRKFRLNGKLELKGVLKDWDFSEWEED
jgi:DNA-binding CsgD family transcriptional regulator